MMRTHIPQRLDRIECGPNVALRDVCGMLRDVCGMFAGYSTLMRDVMVFSSRTDAKRRERVGLRGANALASCRSDMAARFVLICKRKL